MYSHGFGFPNGVEKPDGDRKKLKPISGDGFGDGAAIRVTATGLGGHYPTGFVPVAILTHSTAPSFIMITGSIGMAEDTVNRVT